MLPTQASQPNHLPNSSQMQQQLAQQSSPQLSAQNKSQGQEKSISNSNCASTNSVDSIEYQERNWCDKRDQVKIDHSESLSFINILTSFCVWIFLYVCVSGSINTILGWIIFAICYSLYLAECYSCSLLQSFLQRKHKINDLQPLFNQYLNSTPEIVYQINKLKKSSSSIQISPSQVGIDIEDQQVVNISIQKENNNVLTQLQKNTINFEFDKVTNVCLNLQNLVLEKNAFRLKIEIISKITEQSLNQWKQKKEQFMGIQSSNTNAQILSTFEYSKQEIKETAFYMKSSLRFYTAFFFYSLFSLAGLSVVFRLLFNFSIPTIKVQLEKQVSC